MASAALLTCWIVWLAICWPASSTAKARRQLTETQQVYVSCVRECRQVERQRGVCEEACAAIFRIERVSCQL